VWIGNPSCWFFDKRPTVFRLYVLHLLWSWDSEESQVESCEHQDNANIHHQPFPKPVSEEQEIQADNGGYHRQHVKRDSYLSAHFSTLSSAPLVATFSEPGASVRFASFGATHGTARRLRNGRWCEQNTE
jgi:hypothetical protein